MEQLGQSKGARARARIIAAATSAFGEDTYERVTTRMIAQAAGVRQPAVIHYFDSKAALYRACALEVVETYKRHLSPAGELARKALARELPASEVGRHVRGLASIVAVFMSGLSTIDPTPRFIMRVMAQDGPAFDLIYEEVLGPGLELLANLIGRLRGEGEGQLRGRIEAILLTGGLSGFEVGKPVAIRLLGEEGYRDAGTRQRVVDAYLQQLYRADAQPSRD